MAQDLEYGINGTANGSFRDYNSAHMELPVFLNAHMMWNVMDWA